MLSLLRIVSLVGGLALLGACSSSATTSGSHDGSGAGASAKPMPPPTGFRVVVDVNNRGAALYDLTTGRPVAVTSDADIAAATTPSVWLEPSDPEIEFIAVTVEQPERFRVKERGGQVNKDEVKSGAMFTVADADGRRFQLKIVEYTAGDRETARFVVQVDRL